MLPRRWTAAVALSLSLVTFTTLTTAAPPDDKDKPAESPPAPVADTPEPIRASVTLPDTVVTATKTPTSTDRVGSSISVIEASQLRAHQQRVMTDALRFVPGVDIRRTGGVGSLTSIFTRGTNSNHTKLLLDGIDLADPSTSGGIAQPQFLLSSGIDRIEVLRGPQSALYGSDAIGGVINATTARGEGPLSAYYTQEAGSFRTFLEQVGASAGDDTFNFAIHGAHLESDNISAKAGDDENDPYRNTTLRSRFGITPSDMFETDFYFHAMRTENEFDGFGDPNTDQTDSEFLFFKAAPKLHLADDTWTSTLNLSYARHDRETLQGAITNFNGQVFDLDWQNDITAIAGHTLTIGLDYRHELGEQNGGFSDFKETRNAVAFYAQDQIAIGERVTITPGARVDHYSDFGTHATFRVAAVYDHLETDTLLRASVGTGFNAPAFNELAGFGANPNLDPEKTLSFDVGFEQRLWDDRAAFGATYFHTRFDNLIVSVDTGGFNFVNFNVEEATSQGVEVFAAVEPIKGLTARASYTYNPTEANRIVDFSSLALAEGDRLLRRPTHKASFDVIYAFWDERATAALSLVYVGERDDVGGVGEAYTVVNLAGSVKVHDNVELFGRVENLFDKDYQDTVGFNMPGVSAFGGVRFSF
ncbi:MAG: TonB-dependent receptor [Phycisphaera sp.]|nr:TonB-dependent receptor [Phycisphaera sp.]